MTRVCQLEPRRVHQTRAPTEGHISQNNASKEYTTSMSPCQSNPARRSRFSPGELDHKGCIGDLGFLDDATKKGTMPESVAIIGTDKSRVGFRRITRTTIHEWMPNIKCEAL
jgi:hypothetical protein